MLSILSVSGASSAMLPPMPLSRQLSLAAIALLAAVLGWIRFADSAPARLSALGVPPALAAWLAGAERGATGTGQDAGRAGGRAVGGGEGDAVPVVTRAVTERRADERLRTIGNAMAAASVTVVPRSAGVLTEVVVRSGERVSAGAVLARLDADEEGIARDRAARALRDARDEVERLESLYSSRSVTEVELVRARAAAEDAELALREAALGLERRTIRAPIDGTVGIVPVEVGDYATEGTEIVTVDERSTIIVEFWVPERFASRLGVGQTVEAQAVAVPGERFEGEIDAIGGRVDPDSRTLPARARIDNADDTLRPGMSFELVLRFAGERHAAIDPLAIRWDSNGAFVWRVVDGRAERAAVRVVRRDPESVLVAGDIEAGDEVITEGVLGVRAGAAVRPAGGGGGGEPSDGRARSAARPET